MMSEIPQQCGQRAANIYDSRGYCCAEAVIVTLNGAFRLGLDDVTAAGLGSGFCHGMGGAGCVCGALAGAEMALGLLLGPRRTRGMAKKEFQKKVAAVMHDRFKERYQATCCRVLLKKRRGKQGVGCAELTRGAAELAAELALSLRPELAARVDQAFLAVRDRKN